jgi:hypothetical protein
VRALVYVPSSFHNPDRLHSILDPWKIIQINTPHKHDLLDDYAREKNITLFIKKPNFKLYGNHAPAMRDDRLLGLSELAIVFQEDGDHTAKRLANKAMARNLACHVIYLGDQLALL